MSKYTIRLPFVNQYYGNQLELGSTYLTEDNALVFIAKGVEYLHIVDMRTGLTTPVQGYKVYDFQKVNLDIKVELA